MNPKEILNRKLALSKKHGEEILAELGESIKQNKRREREWADLEILIKGGRFVR